MNRAGRSAIWIATNAGIAACVVYGGVYGVAWCERVSVFMVWLIAAIYVVGAGATRTAKPADVLKGVPRAGVPVWLDVSYDLALVLTLVAIGWTCTAIAHLVGLVALTSIRDDIKKARAAVAKEPASS